MDNKNRRLSFFLVVLFVLIVGVTAISATDVSNDTSVVSEDVNTITADAVDNQDKVISEDINKINNKESLKDSGSTQTVYVNSNSGDDLNDGTSSSTAYKTINKALNKDNLPENIGYKVNRTIHLAAGTYAVKDLNIRYSNVEIIGSGIDKTIINGNGNTIIRNGVFSNITLRDLTVRNGYNSTFSSINLNNEVSLTVNNVKFYNNTGKYGGVIRISGTKSQLRITNSIFDKNNATNRGGALETAAGYEYIKNCTFTNNVAYEPSATSNNGQGGAIYKADENILYLVDSTFTNNYARKGGTLYVIEMGVVDIKGCTFTNNSAKSNVNDVNKFISGGAIYVASGFTNVTNSTFKNNQAQQGGAISINSDTKQNITNCKFINNSAYFRAGAVYNDGILNIKKSTFDKNTALQYGGVLYSVDNSDRIYIYDSNFTNNKVTNTSSKGGVIYLISSKSFLSFDNCYFKSNSAVDGGVIATASQSGTVRVSNSKFESNSASNTGGAVYSTGINMDLMVSNSTFKASKATSEGGSFYLGGLDSNYVFDSSTFDNSVANSKGGAIYVRNYADMDIHNSVFKNCKATNGGAIFNNVQPKMNIKYTTFEKNNASNGSAIYNYKAPESTVNYNYFLNNANTTIYSYTTTLNVRNNYWTAGVNNIGADDRNKSSSMAAASNKYTIYVNANSGNDNNAGTSSSPLKTLDKAVKKYSSAEVTIYLSKGTYTVKNITINNNTEIIGAGSANTILKGSNNVLFTSKATKFTLKNLTLSNGNNVNGLGGVVNIAAPYSELNIENAIVKNNKAMYGGVIAATYPNARISLTNSTFTNNSATTGGVVYSISNGTSLLADTLTVKDSKSVGNGGAFDLEGNNSNYNFAYVQFVNSVSNMNGGAICVINDSYLILHDVSFDKSKALRGGAVYMNTSKKLFGRNCDFKNNYALRGGAIYYLGYGNQSTNPIDPFVQYSTFNNNTNLSISSNINLSAIYNWWGSNNGNNTTNSKVNATRPIVFNMTASEYEFGKIRFKYIFNNFINEEGKELNVNGLLNEVKIYSNDTRIKTTSTNQVKNVNTDITLSDYSKIKFTLDNQEIIFSNSKTGNNVDRVFHTKSITNPSTTDTRSKVNVTFTPGTLNVGDTSQIKVTVTNNSGAKVNHGNVYVKISDKILKYDGTFDSDKPAYTVEVKNGVATLNITPTKEYLNYKNMQVIYPENDLYKAQNSAVKTITVTNEAPSTGKIFINSMNVLSGKYVLTTKVTDGDYNKLNVGRVSYTLDGKWVGSVDVTNGSSWISFNTPAVGNHTIVATYIDAKGAQLASDTYTFEKKAKVNALWNAFNVKNGKVIVITTVKDDQGNNITNGRVSYSLNNKWIGSIDVKNGSSWINFNYNDTTVSFKATYISGSNVTQSIYNRTLNLTELKILANQTESTSPGGGGTQPLKNSSVHIMINSINVLNGSYVLTTKVTNDKYVKLNVGRVSYTLDGKWIGSIDVANGSSWISFATPAVGNHTIVATYVDANGKSITTDTYTFEKKAANVNILFNAYDVKNSSKIVVVTVVKDDKGNNINTGRVSYSLNNKWIGSIDVKNGSSWINFNYTNENVTFKATYINNKDVTQNIYTRTLDLDEIAKLRKV